MHTIIYAYISEVFFANVVPIVGALGGTGNSNFEKETRKSDYLNKKIFVFAMK